MKLLPNPLLIVFSIFILSLNMAVTADSKTDKDISVATFAGGCFWCMEPPFEKLEGVLDVVSGYSGGTGANPTYRNYGEKGHIEVVRITFDSSKVTFKELLDVFWRQIDPTDPGGQFVDRGHEYISAIFFHSDEQRIQAEESKKRMNESGVFKKPIVTEIIKASKFYPAEGYHQNYYKNRPIRYKFYRRNSGRDKFLKKIWR